MQFNVIMTSGANLPVERPSKATIEKLHSNEIFQLNVEMMSMEFEEKKRIRFRENISSVLLLLPPLRYQHKTPVFHLFSHEIYMFDSV